jgi:hypothetical protein
MKVELYIYDDTGREEERFEQFNIETIEDLTKFACYCQKFPSDRYGLDVTEVKDDE